MPLKVLISSVQFQGPSAALRRAQAEKASRLTPMGDYNAYGELVLETEPGREVVIPKQDFIVLTDIAAAA